MPIPYGRQTIDDDDVAAVVAVLRGDWLTTGPAVEAFEAARAAACDAPYAVAFSSGTAALHAACHAAGARAGRRGADQRDHVRGERQLRRLRRRDADVRRHRPGDLERQRRDRRRGA